MALKDQISLCIVGNRQQLNNALVAKLPLITEVIYVESSAEKDLKAAAQGSRAPWVLFCYASESIDLAKLGEIKKELGKQKTWGYAFPVNYWEGADTGVLAERRWEMRLVKKNLKGFTGLGLSLGYPGQDGTRFVEGLEIENPGSLKIVQTGQAGYLKSFVENYQRIHSIEPADQLPIACLEELFVPEVPYLEAWAYYLAAGTLLKAKACVEAEAVLREGLEKYPNHTDLLLLLGELCLEQGKPQNALRCFEQAQALGEGHYAGKKGAHSYLAMYGLGKAYEQLLDLAKSVEYFRQAYCQGFNEPLYSLAQLYIRHLGEETARVELEALIRSQGALDVEVLADAFYVNGCYERALQYLQQAERSSNIAYFQGMICTKLRTWPQAVKAFELVEPGHGLFLRSILQRVFCLWVQSKYSQAEVLLAKAGDADNIEVRQYKLVHSLLRRGAKQNSLQRTEEADWEICLGILNRFLEAGEGKKAAKVAAFLEKLKRQDVQLTLAKIYTLHQDYDKVVNCLRLYGSLGEMTAEAYLYLARANLELGKLAEAFRGLNEQVLEGKAGVETYLLAAQVLVKQSIWVLQTGSEQLQSPELGEKAKQLMEVTKFGG